MRRPAAGASPLTTLRGYRAPRPLAGFQGTASRHGREGKGRGREEGGKGKGSVPALLFYNLTTALQ